MSTLGIIVGVIMLVYIGNKIEWWVKLVSTTAGELEDRLDVIEKRLGITEEDDDITYPPY